MPSKNITLKVDEQLYEKYREYCKKKGLIISRQFEIFMEEQTRDGMLGRRIGVGTVMRDELIEDKNQTNRNTD